MTDTTEPDPRLDDLANDIAALREQLAGTVQQLTAAIVQCAPKCATCAAENMQGQRPGINVALAIIDGTGYCPEHVDLVNGRLVPKKTSGLIITGG